MEERRVVLHEQVTDTDRLHIWARIDAEGNLHVDGHDLGAFVRQLFGCDEYEYTLTVRAADVPAALTALGGFPGDDVLDVLARRWSGIRTSEIKHALEARSVPLVFWTRMGN